MKIKNLEDLRKNILYFLSLKLGEMGELAVFDIRRHYAWEICGRNWVIERGLVKQGLLFL
jgi:hypothetical protein